MRTDTATRGKNPGHVLKANPGIILTLPRNTGTTGGTTGTGASGPAPSRDPTKGNITAAAARGTADTGAELGPGWALLEPVYNTANGLSESEGIEEDVINLKSRSDFSKTQREFFFWERTVTNFCT